MKQLVEPNSRCQSWVKSARGISGYVWGTYIFLRAFFNFQFGVCMKRIQEYFRWLENVLEYFLHEIWILFYLFLKGILAIFVLRSIFFTFYTQRAICYSLYGKGYSGSSNAEGSFILFLYSKWLKLKLTWSNVHLYCTSL